MSLHDFFASHPVFNTEELVAQKKDNCFGRFLCARN